MKLSIISLNFKTPDTTITSFESLYKTYKHHFDSGVWEYILLDNHSEDGSEEVLSNKIKDYPNFHFLTSPINLGFGAGNNLAAKKAKGEYLLFLNNDTKITGEGIDDMLSFAKEKDAAIAGGKLLRPNGTIQPSTGVFYTLFPLFLFLLGMQRFGLLDKTPKHPQQVDWVKGALLLMKKEVFEKLHGFDEKIFMYTEDMELCYRAKKLGFAVYFYPTKGIMHTDMGSSNRSFAIISIFQNLAYFYKKHFPGWEYTVAKLLLQTKAIFLILYGKAFKKPHVVATYEKAFRVVR